MNTSTNTNEREMEMREHVLERVKAIHYMRTVVRPLLVKVGFLALLGIALSFLVSIPHVISNMLELQDFSSYVSYFAYAFANTEMPVRLILVVLVMLGCLLAWDFVKNMRFIAFSHTS